MASEFDLIARLVERLPAPGERVRVGSGDDAAVIEAREATAISVDSIVEGVHFTLPEFPLEAVGRKALAAALSDLAAMGAAPGEAYVAVGVPERLDEEGLLQLGEGLGAVAEREGIAVVGGDLTRAPALFLSVTCVGIEPGGERLVTRSGARPGDALAVTGALGGAAGALALLGSRPLAEPSAGAALDAATRERLVARQLDPRPLLEAGRLLAGAGAGAMIDISDGLVADAGHLAAASGVRIEIEAATVPVADGLEELAGPGIARDLALSGGEDFELLVTLAPDQLEPARAALGARGYGLAEIGSVSEGSGVLAVDAAGREVEASGFDHMRGSRSGSA